MAFLLNRFFTKRRRIVEQIYKRTMASKTLVAFDFDHTLIDENSDIYMQRLAPSGVIPPEIKSMYSSKSWTHYMGSIFSYFHSNGIEKSDILTCMHEIQFTKGMPELLHYLSESDCYETIIISDSNSVFIDTILRHHKLKDTVTEIFTNPAEFDESGCLKIEFYHTQDWCELSTINMCKGAILEDYMEKRRKEGVKFDQVYYIGDGMNDLCPSLRLRDSDFACPRIDFTLWKKIEKSRTNSDAKQEGGPDNLGIKATLLPWNDGYNLLEVMQCAK